MEKQEHLSTDFYFALVAFLLQAKQNIAATAAEFDLSSSQAFALLLIDADKPRSMKCYSQTYECDAGNVTGIIDGLEDRKLVSRRQDSTDRRVKTIYLEKAGATLRLKLIHRLAAVSSDLFASLSIKEQEQFAANIQSMGKVGYGK